MHDDYDGHDHGSELSPMDARVRALETILTEKGYVDPKTLDLIVDTYETKIGPRNGAKVVAKAWVDPDYKARLIRDATAAIAELGYTGRQGEHMVALENSDAVHNLVVCTLCSCYPQGHVDEATGNAMGVRGGLQKRGDYENTYVVEMGDSNVAEAETAQAEEEPC
jgi:nitrile hydratase alpha subunit